jgi:hypothetical protein
MALEWKCTETAFLPSLGADAYVEWALGAGLEAYFGGDAERRASVMVQLQGITAAQFQQGEYFGVSHETWSRAVTVPDEYVRKDLENHGILPGGEDGRSYVVALVRKEFFGLLRDSERNDAVPWISLGRPLEPHTLARSDPESDGAGKATKLPEGTVVMGVIDDAIAFAHERFRDASGGTRVEYAWWQDGDPEVPPTVFMGRQRTKADVDAALGASVDEDAFYRREGLVGAGRAGRQQAALRRGHGTHVMDVACGYPGAEDRTDRPIVAVQLPAHVTADTSLRTLNSPIPFLDWALRYIIIRANRIAQRGGSGPLPVVVNFSYGNLAGPHDGTSDIEQMLDFYIRWRKTLLGVPLEITLASGNSHLSRCHARVEFEAGGPPRTLHWRILPDDRTWSFLEIWLPHRQAGGANRVEVSVATPGGLASTPLGEDTGISQVLEDPNLPAGPPVELCTVTYASKPAPTSRGMFLVAVRHTNSTDAAGPFAPSGRWAVTLHNKTLKPGEPVEVWVERDDTPYGYRQHGRQSYLDEADYRVSDHGGRPIETDDAQGSDVRRAGSINALATGGRTVVMGGFLRREGWVARYSAGGPVTAPAGSTSSHRKGPDALGASEGSSAHPGVLAAGTRSGSVVSMQGTSVAAPQAARIIADALSTGPPYNKTGREIVADRAGADDSNFPPRRATATEERRGAGRVDVQGPVRLDRFWK